MVIAIFLNVQLVLILSDQTAFRIFLYNPSYLTIDKEYPFIRYKSDGNSTLYSAGEVFIYHVEQSDNLQTWSKSGLELERKVDLGAEMEREIWVTSQSLPASSKRFLRVRVTTP
jgi:hypothetical protein